jgi:hypothetical protein
VADIKAKLCKDFDPVMTVDNRVTCRHRDGDHCKLPTHFVCEIYSYKVRQQQHTSVSAINCFLQCPMKYRIRYVMGLEAPMVPAALWLGSQFHDARAKIDERLPYAIPAVPPNCKATPEQRVTLIHTLKFYEAHHAELPHPERSEVLKSGFLPNGTAIQAWLDGYSIGGRMFEYKYTAMPDSYSAKSLRRQLSTYFYLEPNATSATVILCKKLGLRAAKTDRNDLNIFGARVDAELVKLGTTGVFTVKEFSRKEFPVEEEMRSMVTAYQLIEHARQYGQFPCNYMQCSDCELAPVCK